MNRSLLLLLSILTGFQLFAQKAPKPVSARPKLVVGLVIDQMRWDYLYRYYEEYGNDGFKRLMQEGFNCQQTMINYLPTFTAPGHACVYTGSVPSIHGIAGNDWIENATGDTMYCTKDVSVLPVGGSYAAGRMSPKNLWVSTIADELKLATNMRSKVFGIAIKDRGGILPAGHLADGAFWFDDSTGNFMSSSYYGNALPEWLVKFNNQKLPDSFLKQKWELLHPEEYYKQSLPDNNRYEGLLTGETQPVFPHSWAPSAKFGMIRRIPAGNTITLEMAKACLKGAQMGQSGTTDFLAVSLSATDYIGHNYAPNALEVEDMYLRLDKELGAFLKYLDETIGKGDYLFFLTADHGGAHNADYLNDIKIPAGNLSLTPVTTELNHFLRNQFPFIDTLPLVLSLENYQVSLNEVWIAEMSIDRNKLKEMIMHWLKIEKAFAYIIDMENPVSLLQLPEPLREMVVNGYNKERSGCIQMIMKPGWYDGYARTGTTHGTWNPYDAHIPLLWFGWNIKAGETHKTTYMTDISATLAAMLHIQMPNGCVGKVIEEIKK